MSAGWTSEAASRSRTVASRTTRAAIAAAILLLAGASGARAEDGKTSETQRDRIGVDEVAMGIRAVERWQVDEARGVAERALRDLPDSPLTQTLVGEVKMHMSDYRGASDAFQKAREAGAPPELLTTAPLAEATRIATESYEEYVGEHFIVRYTPGRDAILVPYALDTLDKARERIGTLLGWQPKTRVVLEIYPSAGVLAQVSTLTKKEIEASGTIALCKWNRLMVTSPRAIVFGYAWRDTLAHELTHLIIGSASHNTVPIWLHEGIAKYAETAWRAEPGEGLSIEQQTALREAAKKGKLIPFEKMHPSMAKLKSQEETSLAFSEVFTFIEFLVKEKGWEGMRQVLAHMREGESDEEAIQAVHGKPMKRLVDEWMRTLKTRELKNSVNEGAPQKVVVKERPDEPDDHLHGVSKKGRRFARAADLLFARGRLAAAEKELEKAYKETGSPLLSAKLAMVALATGNLDGAEKAARKAIEGTPDLAGPNVTLAEILVRRGKNAEALAALESAISVNPFDPRIHQLILATKDPKRLEAAQQALQLLSREGGSEPAGSLGRGGLIRVEGPPFSRVFLARKAGGKSVATGMVTPSSNIELKPGPWELWLLPPVGERITRTITVEDRTADGTPQRIVPDPTGS